MQWMCLQCKHLNSDPRRSYCYYCRRAKSSNCQWFWPGGVEIPGAEATYKTYQEKEAAGASKAATEAHIAARLQNWGDAAENIKVVEREMGVCNHPGGTPTLPELIQGEKKPRCSKCLGPHQGNMGAAIEATKSSEPKASKARKSSKALKPPKASEAVIAAAATEAAKASPDWLSNPCAAGSGYYSNSSEEEYEGKDIAAGIPKRGTWRPGGFLTPEVGDMDGGLPEESAEQAFLEFRRQVEEMEHAKAAGATAAKAKKPSK